MTTPFLNLVATCSVFVLIQMLAALPWLATLDPVLVLSRPGVGPGWDGTNPGRELPVQAWHGTGTGMGSDLCGMGWDRTGPS